MACSDCKRTADPANNALIPRYAYEAAQAASERHIKRLIIALVIAVLLVFASNGIWLLAWVCYDYSGEESTVDITASDGVANYIGGAGAIRNGGE